MRIELDRTGTVHSFEELLLGMAEDPDVNGLLVFSCDANGYTPESINTVLQCCPVPLSGGCFPGIIHGRKKMDTGTIVVGLSKEPSITVFEGLSDPEADYISQLDRAVMDVQSDNSIFIIVDGFAERISSFINALFISLGLEINIFGGGTGSLSLERKPYIMTEKGMLEDCAVLTSIPTSSEVNISHGWHPIKGPFKVTGASSNVITSLDWMPAFNIYREAIRSHSGKYLTRENFKEISMSYPLGLSRMCCDYIIRDPVKMDKEGNLVCVGEINEGAFVEIMHGSTGSLIDASKEVSSITGGINRSDKSLALMVDCISRALFMADNFEEELQAVRLPDIPLVGVLSFGEIGTKFRESLEFHNKTTVLSILEEL